MKKKVEIKKPSRRRWRALLMDSGLQFKHCNRYPSRKSLYWYKTVSWGWGFGEALYFFSRFCCAGIVFGNYSLPSPPSENHDSSLRRQNRMERRSWKLGAFGLNMARLHFYTVPMLHSMTTVLRHSLYVCPTYKKRKSLGCGIQTPMWGLQRCLVGWGLMLGAGVDTLSGFRSGNERVVKGIRA